MAAQPDAQSAGTSRFTAFTSGPFGQGILALTLLGGTVYALMQAVSMDGGADKLVNSTPVLFVGGLVVLMLALGGLASLLASISMSDQRDAFGLPPGTVRALLALGLLVVFVVFGIGNVDQLAGSGAPIGNAIRPAVVREADVDKTIARYELAGLLAVPSAPAGSATDRTVEIHLYPRTNPKEANDLAKQLTTMISTLLTTVVGFYFGSRSVADSPAKSGIAGAGAAAAADAEMASRELDIITTQAAPTLALIEELRTKVLTDEQKTRAAPLQADVDRRLAELRAAQDVIGLQLQAARTAAEAASKAEDATVATTEQQKAAAAVSEVQSQLRSLASVVTGLEQAAAALRDATAEG